MLEFIPGGYEMAERYIELLTGDKTTPMNWRCLDDKKEKRTFQDFCNVRWLRGYDTLHGLSPFVVVNEGGNTDAEITKVRAVFVDGDDMLWPARWHAQPNFMTYRDARHWHAYWLVKDVTVDQFANTQKRLALLYGTDPVVHNPSRIMRVPGFYHCKETPKKVYLSAHEASHCRYTMKEVTAGLPDLPPEEIHSVSKQRGTPVTARQLVQMLSYIDPTFSDNHATWVGIAKAIRWGQLPCAGISDWIELLDLWCSGELWRRRTDSLWQARTHEKHTVSTYYGLDEILARTRDKPREEGKTIGIGTIIALARKGGYTGGAVDMEALVQELGQ